ncbi:MAG TPA: hypothetical protein VNS63_26890 [Blastocatellia bacterium]|nr:hypothetical protein [Blastocatellia bacterium]
MRTARVITLCFFLFFSASPILSRSISNPQETRTERFSASLVILSGPGSGKVVPITVYISDYSTDAEANQLAGAFADGGSKALFKVLTKMKSKSRVAPIGGVGYQFRFIRSVQTPNGRKILMLTDRPIGFLEAYYGTRSKDYKYGLIELNVNDEGKGEGSLIYAAKVKAISADTIEVENFGIQPARLTNVRKE